MKTVMYAAGLALAVLYILNPTAGVFEMFPDNLPVIGNLDEAGAVVLALTCWRRLRDRGRQTDLPSESGRGST